MQIQDRTTQGGPRPRTILLMTAGLILLVLATSFLAGREQRARDQAEMDVRLRTLVLQRTAILSRALEDMRAQARFLSLTPPVAGLARAEAGGGYDASEKTDAALWHRRLEAIFTGYAVSQPAVERLALLSARDHAPIVAVENRDGRPRGTGISYHPDLDLLDMLDRRSVGDMLLSGPDLVREGEAPPRPLLRLAVALSTVEGGRFGALTLALDARGLLADLTNDINPIYRFYMLDAQENFLLHPDPQRRFTGTRPGRWDQEFRPPEAAARSGGVQAVQGPDGVEHVLRQRVTLDGDSAGRYLTIIATVPDSIVAANANKVRLWVAGLGLLLVGLLVLVLVFFRLASRRDRALMASDAWLGAIVDSASDAIIGLSADGRVTSWNGAATAMFGRTAEDAIGRATRALIVPPGLEIQEDELLARVARGENVVNLRTRRLHAENRPIDVSITATPVRGADGTMGAAMIIRDITDQMVAEAGIRDLNSRLEQQVRERTMEIEALAALRNAILHCAGSAIIACDRSGTITLFNPAAETMLGYDPHEMVGKATPALFHDPVELGRRGDAIQADRGQPILSAMDVLAEGTGNGGVEMREWSWLRKDGTRLPVLLAVTTLTDRGGDIAGYLIIATDISAQVRDAARLREALAGAEASSRAKSAFLANMGHEIRTPLNGIIGSAHLMLDDPLTDNQRTHVDSIRRAGSALLAIINDILDYSRIDAGQLLLETAPFFLSDPVSAVADLYAPVVRARHVALDIAIDPTLPAWVMGDAGRLRQILDNLVGNAVKFTPSGAIGISLRQRGRGPDGRVDLTFIVSDTGIGMSPEQVARLFQPFTQGDESHRRSHGGTGLGLALTHRLVGMMGGTIRAESVSGQGSRFIIDLCLEETVAPARPPRAAVTPAIPADDMSGLHGARILLVEDNELNQVVARSFLDRSGAVTMVVDNGEEAVAAFQRESFDLVLMDLQMPVMDGLEATRAIRGLPAGRNVPILALTAAGHIDDLKSCLEAGMDDHIDKPFVPALFLSTLRRWLAGTQDEPPPAPVTPPPVLTRPDPISGIDLDQAMGRVLGNRALLEMILDQFVARFDGLGTRLARRLAAGDTDMAVRKLHELRGAAGNISALAVTELATDLEHALRADATADHSAALAGLEAALEAVVAAIRNRTRPHPSDTAPVAPPPAAQAATAPPPHLADLRAALRSRRLTALDVLAECEHDLTRRLGTDKFRNLSTLVEALRYEDALALLESEFPA